MKKKCKFCLSATLWLIVFLLVMSGMRRKEEALAARIAPEILRFHVLANSDSPEDQALKLEVKDLLLKEIQDGLDRMASGQTASSQTASDQTVSGQTISGQTASGEPVSKELFCRYIKENSGSLKETAEAYMEARGFSYQADIRLERCEFPEKTYGDMTFPAGTYDAVRVLIGDGAGKNFWCVLYPSLCYLDSTHAVVPDSSKAQLMAVLPEDDFAALVKARHPESLADMFRPAKTTARPHTDTLRPDKDAAQPYTDALRPDKDAAQPHTDAFRSAKTAAQVAADMPDSEKNTEQDFSLPRINIRFKLAELCGNSR